MTNEAKPLSPAALQRLQRERDILWIALHAISKAQTPAYLRHRGAREYGLDAAEAIEYAYDNVREVAKMAIKGLRRPKG